MTTGASQSSFSDRGINGRPADVLHPVQHGLFRFTGMAPPPVLPLRRREPLLRQAGRVVHRERLQRLAALFTDETIACRPLAGGEYDHGMRLLPGVEAAGTAGLGLHVRPRS